MVIWSHVTLNNREHVFCRKQKFILLSMLYFTILEELLLTRLSCLDLFVSMHLLLWSDLFRLYCTARISLLGNAGLVIGSTIVQPFHYLPTTFCLSFRFSSVSCSITMKTVNSNRGSSISFLVLLVMSTLKNDPFFSTLVVTRFLKRIATATVSAAKKIMTSMCLKISQKDSVRIISQFLLSEDLAVLCPGQKRIRLDLRAPLCFYTYAQKKSDLRNSAFTAFTMQTLPTLCSHVCIFIRSAL